MMKVPNIVYLSLLTAFGYNKKDANLKNCAQPNKVIIMRERRLRWFGHVEHSSGAIRTAHDIQIEGRRDPKQTWKKLTEKIVP